MRIFIELLPFVGGFALSFLLRLSVERSTRQTIWLGLSLVLGLLINYLSGEGLAWAALDIALVAASSAIFALMRRQLPHY
ncbi:hypothetical protein [Hymenobacter lucidus]|uniref:DUF2198 family protein n=1 Tax=Hymenobacter lucidus TaxID=2880930 RepID=A0ABS8AXF8_9BACT|nr:hypothetical protein [Hymenobacter lucidus]MCB2410501.1 hypothetical protein [Hymenobacter lucidus]